MWKTRAERKECNGNLKSKLIDDQTWFRDFGALKIASVALLEFGKDEVNVMPRVLMEMISMGSR